MAESPARNLKVLFVCTGNICRSAMAQALMSGEVQRRGLRVDVRSAGTHALSGAASTLEGRIVMSRLGAPIDDHLAVAMAPFVAEWADVILGMTRRHVRIIRRSYPVVTGRTFTLRGLVDALPALPSIDDLASWLHQAYTLVEERPDHDIDDPIGRSVEVYERVAAEIAEAIGQLADGLERMGLGPRVA